MVVPPPAPPGEVEPPAAVVPPAPPAPPEVLPPEEEVVPPEEVVAPPEAVLPPLELLPPEPPDEGGSVVEPPVAVASGLVSMRLQPGRAITNPAATNTVVVATAPNRMLYSEGVRQW